MKRILFVFLALAAIGAAVGYYMYNKAPEGAGDKKPDYSLTPKELMTEFQTNEETANAKYLGKVVQLNGQIQEIIPGEDMQMQVILDTGDALTRVSCVMEEDYQSFLERKLQKGDTVTIKGYCTGIAMDVVVDRCVIVS